MTDGSWSSILKNIFFAAAGAASANLIANITCRDNYGNIDWRDLAILTTIGTTLGVRYAQKN